MPTLVATAADPLANSYVTDAEMVDFVDRHLPGPTIVAWNALSTQTKHRYLIQATAMIDRAHRYLGRRITDLTGAPAQALEFPRASLMTRGGKANVEAYRGGGTVVYVVDERVKKAQMEQALFMCHVYVVAGSASPIGGSTRATLQAEGVASISIGNTSETYTGKPKTLCAAAEDLLRPLIRRHDVM